jgi:multidrug resistance efflux pump
MSGMKKVLAAYVACASLLALACTRGLDDRSSSVEQLATTTTDGGGGGEQVLTATTDGSDGDAADAGPSLQQQISAAQAAYAACLQELEGGTESLVNCQALYAAWMQLLAQQNTGDAAADASGIQRGACDALRSNVTRLQQGVQDGWASPWEVDKAWVAYYTCMAGLAVYTADGGDSCDGLNARIAALTSAVQYAQSVYNRCLQLVEIGVEARNDCIPFQTNLTSLQAQLATAQAARADGGCN